MANINNNATIVSGVPKYVGAPVDAYIAVGSELTKQYQENKNKMLEVNSSLKKIEVADDIDKNIIHNVSSYVDSEFKDIIDNDNYQHANSKITDIANFLVNDNGLKGVTTNYALLQKGIKEYDDRIEKDPSNTSLREAKDAFVALTKMQYRNKGGALDANGNYQQLKFISPSTNMNLNDEIKTINDAVSKIKASTSTYFGNEQYIDLEGIIETDNAILKKAISKLSEDKIKTTRITKEQLREAAIKELEADPDYQLKKQEINFINHFRKKGDINVKSEDLLSLLNSKNSSFVNNLAVELSPTFKNSLSKLQEDYNQALLSNNPKLANSIASKISNLRNNKDIIKEGLSKLTELTDKDIKDNSERSQIENLYYGILDKEIDAKVLGTVDKYAYSETDIDRKHFDSAITAYLSNIKDKKEDSLGSTSNPIASYSIALNTDVTNPDGEFNSKFTRIEAAYKASLLPDSKLSNSQKDDLKFQYENLVNSKKSQLNTLYASFKNASPETQKEIIKDAMWSWSSGGTNNVFNKYNNLDKTESEIFNDILSKNVNLNKIGTNYQNIYKKGLYSKINPSDLLNSTNEEIIKKYTPSISIQNVPSDILKHLDKQRNSLVKSVANNTNLQKSVITYALNPYGTTSEAHNAAKINVLQSFNNVNENGEISSMIDIHTGKPLKLDNNAQNFLKYVTENNKELNVENLNDFNGFNIKIINTNGYGNYTKTSPTLQITIPKGYLDKERGGKFIPTNQTQTFEVAYTGNSELLNNFAATEFNRLAKQVKNKNLLSSDMVNSAYQWAYSIGKTSTTNKGTPLQDIISEINLQKQNGQHFVKRFYLNDDKSSNEHKYNGYSVEYTGGNDLKITNLTDKGSIEFRTQDASDILTSIGLLKLRNYQGIDTQFVDGLQTMILQNGR